MRYESMCENVGSLPPDVPILQDEFLLSCEGLGPLPARCFLYHNAIFLHMRKQDTKQKGKMILKLPFSFELGVGMEKGVPGSNESIGKPTGLKLERQQIELLLAHSSAVRLLTWRQKLAHRLNLRDFNDNYRPVRKIGQGNFASVFLVKRIVDQNKFAVKVFSKEAVKRESCGWEALRNEITTMRSFNQKNLLSLQEVYQTESSIYLVVQYLEGGSLQDRLHRGSRLRSHQVKTVMKGALEGLEVMHAQGIMHRDIKPQNILLRSGQNYDCVIGDFGLVQKVDEHYLYVRCGTPGYVAPEVVNTRNHKTKYTQACDIFSLGVVFHYLALRRSPFPGRQFDDILQKNRACKITYKANDYVKLPNSWMDLLQSMLHKDPQKRITASQALEHPFFANDDNFKDFVERRLSGSQNSEEITFDNIDLARRSPEKKKRLMRDDSCLRFKMGEQMELREESVQDCESNLRDTEEPKIFHPRSIKINLNCFKGRA